MLYHAALHEGTAKVDRWSMFWSVCVCVCHVWFFASACAHKRAISEYGHHDEVIRLKHDCMCTCPFAVAVSDQFLQLS